MGKAREELGFCSYIVLMDLISSLQGTPIFSSILRSLKNWRIDEDITSYWSRLVDYSKACRH